MGDQSAVLKKAWNAIKSAAPPGEGKLVTVNFKDGQKARAALSRAGLKVSGSKGDWNTGRWYLRLDMPKTFFDWAAGKGEKPAGLAAEAAGTIPSELARYAFDERRPDGKFANLILDDGGDATLLVHKGLEFNNAGEVPSADSEP